MNCSHFEIFDYWKDKIITDRFDVEVYDYKKHKSTGVMPVADWGEPECWACGKYIKINNNNDNLKKTWNDKKVASKLNRCHIIPKALGGLNSPENMFLMCEECHYLSPDTIYKKGFFIWVYDRKKCFEKTIFGFNWLEISNNINEYKKMLGVEGKIANKFNLKKMKNKTNVHAGKLSQSTLEMAILFSVIDD